MVKCGSQKSGNAYILGQREYVCCLFLPSACNLNIMGAYKSQAAFGCLNCWLEFGIGMDSLQYLVFGCAGHWNWKSPPMPSSVLTISRTPSLDSERIASYSSALGSLSYPPLPPTSRLPLASPRQLHPFPMAATLPLWRHPSLVTTTT